MAARAVYIARVAMLLICDPRSSFVLVDDIHQQTEVCNARSFIA